MIEEYQQVTGPRHRLFIIWNMVTKWKWGTSLPEKIQMNAEQFLDTQVLKQHSGDC